MSFFSKNPNPRVQDEINKSNISRIHKMSYIVIVMEVFMIIFSFIIELPPYYQYSYYSLLVLSVLFNIFTREKYHKKIKLERIVINVAIYLFSSWGIIISFLDNSRNIAAYVYFINISAIVCFLVSTPKEMLVFNLINMTVFLSLFYFCQVLTYPLFINIVCFHIVLIAIAIDKYHSIATGIEARLELNQSNHELKVLSTIDQLSGCKNRRGLTYELEKYSGQVIFALLTDIDNFKEINDKYGHDIGDLFIVNFAKILQSNFGVNNVFRIGGDEFFIISNCEPLADCLKKFEISCNEIADITFVANANLKMTTSAGYTNGVINNEEDFIQLYKRLDIALYASKNAGKNTVLKADNF
jgi:diguanylate cyclase (GGDEF)-like protein